MISYKFCISFITRGAWSELLESREEEIGEGKRVANDLDFMTLLLSNDSYPTGEEDSFIAFPDICFNLEVFDSIRSLIDSSSKSLSHLQFKDGCLKVSYKDWQTEDLRYHGLLGALNLQCVAAI